ncbi:non-ribosomal peptide synthetase [Photobacterium galatheae]|uniref:Carrier domain-containing protein n=1 Tax=Photobacterium galatheae TaxID=1654360 RepID=A0A066RNX7_9GAMM|nr:non-ribosomal peptide synthetase [Photobacterium galatheae]KDM90806.1 hypothetical protein EA58_15585 [Photobacterium galatheae]MCM0149865.1 non-ribosomal peptide synthetase [Photobacterium galatheae]
MDLSLLSLVGLADYWEAEDHLRIAVTDGKRALTYAQLTQAMSDRFDEIHQCGGAKLLRINRARTIDSLVTIMTALQYGIPFEVGECADTWQPESEYVWPPYITKQDEPAYIMSTSGSSGAAKQTLVTRRGLQTVFTGLQTEWREDIPDYAIWTQLHPMTFGYSICEILGCLMFKGTLRILPREEPLTLKALADIVKTESTVVSCLTPSELNLYVDHFPEYIPSHIILSGEPAHRISWEAASRVLKDSGSTVINTYAATETSGQVTSHVIDAENWPSVRAGYVGKMISGIDVQILNDEGSFIPPSDTESIGEIIVSGDSIAAGYLHNSVMHHEKFKSSPERRFKTGDRGQWAVGGGLFVVGRASRTLKLAGVWVDLDDIERALLAQAWISEVATFYDEMTSVDGSMYGRLNVVCVPRKNDPLKSIHRVIADILPQPVPVCVHTVQSIPKLPNGKLDTSQLNTGTAPDAKAPISEQIIFIWRQLLGDSVRLDTDVFATGLDSLGVVVFIKQLEGITGTKVPVRLVFDHPVIKDQISQFSMGLNHSVKQRPRKQNALDIQNKAALRRSVRQRNQ